MPEKSQTLTINGQNASSLLALAYGTFEKLNWNIKYAGENILLGYTPRSGFRWDMEITIRTTNDQLIVTSKMIHNESFDMMSRNKKNIDQFTGTFESVKSSATTEQIQTWHEKIERLKEETIRAAEQEAKQATEVDKVMNFSSSNMYLTYGIIAINLIVFVLMVIDGAGLVDLNALVHIKWGSNYTPLTYSGDWWRLITNIFIHFGIFHVLMNMYALYYVGMFLEPMLGKTKFITAYLCTGVFASLVSLWWHSSGTNSAGASGAIFGMYGIFLALLTTKIIPSSLRAGLLQSIGIFVLYNLVYGMKSGVDNAAHLGGLLSGFVIGYMYWFNLKTERQQFKIAPLIIIAITVTSAWLFLQQKTVSDEERKKALLEIKDAGYRDSEKFLTRYNEFVELQDKALALFNDTTITTEEFKNTAQQISFPSWSKAENLLAEMEKMDVSGNDQKKVKLLKRYVELRKQELQLREEMITAPADDQQKKLEDIIVSINGTMDDFKQLQSPGSN